VPRGIDDSKALSEPQREALDAEIRAAAWVGIGIADVERIDRDNILQATLWAMRTAVGALDQAPDLALIDGNACPPLGCATVAVVGGDARSLSIAAASIIAKVTRDRIMRDLAVRHPAYGWDDNKGYGTQRHAEGIERAGLTPLHRRSFRPIREYARRFGEPARVACQSDSAGGLI
jgi:ribonuclease HII